eukprot:SAG31_NODE_401_length_16206_cov_10.920780_10_plen_113_part_00
MVSLDLSTVRTCIYSKTINLYLDSGDDMKVQYLFLVQKLDGKFLDQMLDQLDNFYLTTSLPPSPYSNQIKFRSVGLSTTAVVPRYRYSRTGMYNFSIKYLYTAVDTGKFSTG